MRRLQSSKAAKIIALLLILVCALVFLPAAERSYRYFQDGVYTLPQWEYTQRQMRTLMGEDARYIVDRCLRAKERAEFEKTTTTDRPNSFYEFFINGERVSGDYSGEETSLSQKFDLTYYAREILGINPDTEEPIASSEVLTGKQVVIDLVEVVMYVRNERQSEGWDSYYGTAENVSNIYQERYTVLITACIPLGLSLLLLVFLLIGAGHKKGEEGIGLNRFDKLPLDLLVVAVLFLLGLTFASIYNFFQLSLFSACLIVFGSTTLMSLAARIKAGKGWWKNTLIYKLAALVKKLFDFFAENMRTGIAKTPFILKCILGILLVLIVEIWIFWGFSYSKFFIVFFILEKLVLVPAGILIVLWIKSLSVAAQKISGGDMDYQVDTSKMFGEFKKQGTDLNSIAGGMNRAVEEKLRSERMKTELITNVSHDIKTPLTSIINYVDLIGKEETENEKITEYTEVLSRQADKLKRLITDLVEASKLSSGNIEVNMAPSDANVLTEQIDGEYRDRLQEKGLQLITTIAENPAYIMADSRHLWRIFDNLMNNVIKYSQENSRVYLNVERRDKNVRIILRNMSKYQLNISSDELVERFVRGDSSRTAEGNGLGLSIARSLTDVQNGIFKIEVDGDLFKVILQFPVLG